MVEWLKLGDILFPPGHVGASRRDAMCMFVGQFLVEIVLLTCEISMFHRIG